MPVYRVQSPDGREVELEGDVEPSDSDLDEVFAGLPPRAVDNRPKISTPSLSGEIESFRSPFPQVQPRTMTGELSGAPDTDFTRALFHELPSDIGTKLHDIGDVLYEGGVAALQHNIEELKGLPADTEANPGLTTEKAAKTYPKPVQVGIKMGEGLTRSLPQMGIAMVNPVAGAAAFGMTPDGFDPKAAAIAGALPFLGSKAGLLTEAMALKAGVPSQQALQTLNRLGGVAGAAGLIAADEAIRISQLPKEQQEAAWLDAAANVGSQFLLGAVGHMERPKLSQLATAIESAPVRPRATVDESAQIRSGLPPRGLPELNTEAQQIRQTADTAIRGQAKAVNLPAEKPITEEVIAEPVKVEPKPAEVLPETEAAYAQPNKPEVAARGTGERKDSYGEPTGTRYHATPEDWSVWQDVSSKPLTEPGVWATREAIKNKYGGMPPEAPLENKAALAKEPPTPHPDAIKAIGKQLWNDSIDVAIAAVKAGRAVKVAIAEAISHIKRNARNYDETQIRANIESVLKDEGLVSKSVKASPSTAEGVAKSDAGIVVPEGQKQRSYSARASVSEKVPTPVQEAIKTDERSSYTPQNVASVVEQTKGMTDAQLFSVKPDNNIYGAARQELAQRAFDRGDNQTGLDIVQESAEAFTKAGQVINQAKLLNSLKPEHQVLVVNENLKKAGKDPLTEAQTKKALDLARDAKAKQSELDSATEAWKKNPTPENAKLAEDALTKANKAALESQRFNNAFQPRSTALLLKAILQGNLLTPISQTANLVGNLSFLPFRAGTRGIAATMDILQSAVTGQKRTSSVGPISGTAEAAKGLVRGAKNIPGILKEGTGNTILGETRQGLHPIQAWMKQFSSNPDMATKGGKLGLKERLNLLLEGTLGIPAEIMLRGLGAGDQPFREAAKARITAEQLRLAKVPKEQWSMAQKFPELFFDGKTLEAIKDNTDYAVFQRNSKTLGALTQWISSKGPVFDFAVSTVAPYKLTPWNIIGEILSYNPVVAAARGTYEAAKGNRLEANKNAGKLVVGTLLTTAAYQLYKNGLLSPSLDSKDETMKERILMGQVMPPNHVNISGLKRYLEGGDPAFQPGDKTVDVMRSGGLAGAFMYMTANVGRDLEKNPEGDASDVFKSILTQSTLEQARFGMNQSFLSGVEGLLSAVKDGNADNYVRSWANTVTSIPLPNTLSALGRATRENKPDVSSDKLDTKIENVFRNKLGIAGLDDKLPLKRGLWGEPIPETPKGRNPYAYHLFDVSKGQQITDDPKTLEIFRLWRKTDDSKVIPTPASNRLTVKGTTYMLTPKQTDELGELVGTKRAKITDAIVTNPNWHTLSDESKIKMLGKIYEKGLDYGKSVFYLKNKDSLKEKPQKAGFQTP